MTVDSLDTPSSAALKSWLVVARSASTRVRLIGHLGWVHRQEARAVGRPRERMMPLREALTPRRDRAGFRTEGTRGTTVPGRAIKATRLSNRLQPRATRSLRASLVHSLDQSPVHGGTVNKELLRTVTNTTRAAQQGAWATRFDAGQAGGECRRQATTDRARPTDGRNGPNGSAPQCVQRCAASPIHANRRLCSEDQPAQLRTRSQQPTTTSRCCCATRAPSPCSPARGCACIVHSRSMDGA